jgi:hypothetical protein
MFGAVRLVPQEDTMHALVSTLAITASLLFAGCAQDARVRFPTTDRDLELSRVVLYRNGIGYFERHGGVDGDTLTLKVRKDQINDLLKSLTIVDRKTGRAVSVSMPLDPQSWANAALATLSPGQGSLAQVLDALRGTTVVLSTTEGKVAGRIAMVEQVQDEPDPSASGADRAVAPGSRSRDFRITLMQEQKFNVVRLSKVQGVELTDGDLAMQFHRSLDATAGEGMFQQVDVNIRLVGPKSHDLAVSYVVSAPMWKPTYRVVLPEAGKGDALLQAWAVVDNTSGEDWRQVTMQLTSGEPMAFRYDLHTPRDVSRSDLTETGVRKRASVAVGETTYSAEEQGRLADNAPSPMAPPPPAAQPPSGAGPYDRGASDEPYAPKAEGSIRVRPGPVRRRVETASLKGGAKGDGDDFEESAAAEYDRYEAPAPAVDIDSLRRSTQAQTRATAIAGLTRFDLEDRVTVPEGTSTMVAIVNQTVQAEETFLFKPGGAGVGYESNPYRVVRFKNSTPFVLEPGPISIYSGGSFVGEGLSEAVGAGTSATIPFAVEPGIMVSSAAEQQGEEMRLVRLVRGVLEVETFSRTVTTWDVKAQTLNTGFTVLVRHNKAGSSYSLKDRPEGTEDLPDAYLVPIKVAPGALKGMVKVVEQTPSRTSLSIWDTRSVALLEQVLLATNLGAEARAKLQPIVKLRQDIGRIDTKIDGMRRQQIELDQRASETRKNLLAIQKDQSGQARALRTKLQGRLDDFTKEGDRLGRDIVSAESERLEKKIQLEDMLQNLDLSAPEPIKAKP